MTTGPTTDTVNVTTGPQQDFLFNGTGSLPSGTVLAGAGAGTISFATAIGTVTAEAISGLFTFTDGQGGNYVFDLTSARTVSASTGDSNQFGLYLLGQMSDAYLGLTPTVTSLSLTFNNTNGSAYSLSGSLSNPPAAPPTDVPEPASIVLLGLGLAGVGMMRRRAK